MSTNNTIKNEIIINYLNGTSAESLAKSYNLSITTINSYLKKYKPKEVIKIYLLDEENISYLTFTSLFELNEKDALYVYTRKPIKETKNITKIYSPIIQFKNSLDYRLIIGIGEALQKHKKEILNHNVELSIISNDKLFLEVINSIDANINVISIINDNCIAGGYRKVKCSKSLIPAHIPSPSEDNTPKHIITNPRIDKLLCDLDNNVKDKILTMFYEDLENKSVRLNPQISNMLAKSIPDNLGLSIFSSMAKEFKTLKNEAI